jgi:hypothetical protein
MKETAMNETQLKGMRLMAGVVTQDGSYRLYDGKGRLVMFDITKERAEEYARYYPGAKVVRDR